MFVFGIAAMPSLGENALELVLGSSVCKILGADWCVRRGIPRPLEIISFSSRKEPLRFALRMLLPAMLTCEEDSGRIIISTSSAEVLVLSSNGASSLSWRFKLKILNNF